MSFPKTLFKSPNRRKTRNRKFKNIPLSSQIFNNLTKTLKKNKPVAKFLPIIWTQENIIVLPPTNVIDIDLTFKEAINQRPIAYFQENYPSFQESIMEIDLTVFRDSENGFFLQFFIFIFVFSSSVWILYWLS